MIRKITYRNISHSMTRLLLLLTTLLILAGCSSSASVQIDRNFPSVLAKPKPIAASIVLTEEFSNYIAQPNDKTVIDLGSAQVQVMKNAFAGLFNKVEFATTADQITTDNGLIITPSVREVQVSTPSDNYLNVFEVWIKYNLDIADSNGDPIVCLLYTSPSPRDS